MSQNIRSANRPKQIPFEQNFSELKKLEQELEIQMANAQDAENILKLVTKKINDIVEIDAQNSSVNDRDKIFKTILDLVMKEQQLEDRWIEERKKKEDIIVRLESKWVDTIKSYHSEKGQNPRITPTDVSRSNLWKDIQPTESLGDRERDWKIHPKDILVNEKYKLGEGEYASYFRGIYFGKEVAVKVLMRRLDSQDLKILYHDCQKMMEIPPNDFLIGFVGAALENEPRKLVFEIARYGSIQTIFTEQKFRLSFIRKWKIIDGIGKALQFLHGQLLTYFKLKPANILLTRDWKIKLSDFSLTYQRDQIVHGVRETIPFVAPEILQNFSEISSKADIYSFGMCLLYIFSQELPYSDIQFESQEHLLHHCLKNRPEIHVGIPPSMRKIIVNAIRADPRERLPISELINPPSSNIGSGLDVALTEAAKLSVEQAKQMWISASDPKQQRLAEKLPWDIFIAKFCEYLNISVPKKVISEDQHFKALRVILKVPVVISKGEQAFVNYSTYEKFVLSHSPIRRDEGPDILFYLLDLIKEPWYHGELERPETTTRLKKSNIKNGFLVRFSQNSGKYVISWITEKGKDEHMVVSDSYNNCMLPFYVSRVAKEKSLTPVTIDREMYESIFTSDSKAEIRGFQSFSAGDISRDEDNVFVGSTASNRFIWPKEGEFLPVYVK